MKVFVVVCFGEQCVCSPSCILGVFSNKEGAEQHIRNIKEDIGYLRDNKDLIQLSYDLPYPEIVECQLDSTDVTDVKFY